ncbi:MAG TPA: 4-hydroxybenzoate 3-monooxygenase [Azospirillum sp.]|nr:4-hydroxybenzoate 3-monooxygenase [Azospirillum sp.]
MRTQVGIVGAGPAGLVLAHLLHLHGIESVIVEDRSREYCEHRIRAGVLEQGTADLLIETGVGERLLGERLLHHGIELRFEGRTHRVDFADLTGHAVTVYGQHEVVKDLIAARLAAGLPILFETAALGVEAIDGPAPRIRIRGPDGRDDAIDCDFVAGCDGFRGVCRAAVPAGAITAYERVYPYAWLGILAEAPPSSDELIYTSHERGFALLSMRSPELSRLYIQVSPEDDIAAWPDARIWEEMHRRFAAPEEGWSLTEGPILQKGITAMRSFVAEPMRFGRLFLAGDAAHIVPPTGAKGMNLAVADVRVLARALDAFYGRGRTDLLNAYSEACLRRVWRVQHFSWWMTQMLHRDPAGNPFDRRRQLAELEGVVASRAVAQALAENYVGLPFE